MPLLHYVPTLNGCHLHKRSTTEEENDRRDRTESDTNRIMQLTSRSRGTEQHRAEDQRTTGASQKSCDSNKDWVARR